MFTFSYIDCGIDFILILKVMNNMILFDVSNKKESRGDSDNSSDSAVKL